MYLKKYPAIVFLVY